MADLKIEIPDDLVSVDEAGHWLKRQLNLIEDEKIGLLGEILNAHPELVPDEDIEGIAYELIEQEIKRRSKI